MTIIPLTSATRQEANIVVFGLRVSVVVYWHPLSNDWHIDVDYNGDPVVRGRRITLDANLTKHTRDNRLIGALYCRAASDNILEDPLLEAWGTTHHLVHEML